ncbi:NAD(P)/FAD-dependent oxidoreductase [Nonomuraea endophytica]|uniref:Glycine/D-amino acid oxidase-like deaminating enzyme n=1 Tax=Nonomuraea endophytica TaxID=714136 RepID=A0A7W8A400_9ACTN|nr:FAD-dependent oxidoreductase [Nonomuraea endophytica]MBB5079108.1 glycine/D-amino acid oxidase-like deaminating enzyme [Nonomuraea endophytica]
MNADVVVIGAGVIGASIAHELAGSGLNVLVVDKGGSAGCGSTGASSAVVRFTFSTWDGVALAWEARHCWESWRDHLGAPAGEQLPRYHRTGLVMLDAPVAPRARILPLFDRAGVPYEEWDADTLAARVPGIDTGRHWPPARLDDERFWTEPAGRLGAVYTPDAGYVDDPQLAAAGLAAAASRRGASFRYRQEVVEVARAHGRVRGVRLADDTLLAAPIVVNAAGPWSAALNRLAGVTSVRARPLRQEVHHVAAAPPGFRPIVADLDLGVYLRGEPGGGLLVGGTEPACDPLEWLEDPGQAAMAPTAAAFETQVTRAARRFPALTVPGRAKGVAGVYDVTDDWTPVYDRTELPGFYVAMGTSGNQFKNAPVVGRIMTALIEAVEGGHDHDREPLDYLAPHTGHRIGLGAFSRKRPINTDSTGTVMG